MNFSPEGPMSDEMLDRKDQIFQRLAKLIKCRFGATATFTDITSRMRIADVRTLTTVQRRPSAPLLIIDQDVVFPLRFETHLFGYVTLFNGLKLGETTIDQIKDLIDMLLLETCILEDKQQRLKIIDHYLGKELSFDEVIELKDRLKSEDIHHIDPEISINKEALDQVFPILVQSQRDAEGKEFALEIHKTTERSGFITYEPYLLSEIATLDSLFEMGPVTLYIPNICLIPLDVQMTLAAFLRSPHRSTLHPRLIVGIHDNPESLITTGHFDSILFEKLSSARIKLPPKGTSTMTTEEILSFFDHTQPRVEKSRHLYLVSPSENPH